jgi:FolB domain-containing protein
MKIKDLSALTMLGVYGWEREQKRQVFLNIELHIDSGAACKSDALIDAVDYAILEEKIIHHLENSEYNLLEKLVADVGNLLLAQDSRIKKAIVEVDKSGALKYARSVSVCAEFVA